jgi:hypothetical protein
MDWKSAYERENKHRRQLNNERRRWIHNALPPLPYFPALPFNEHHFRPNLPEDLIRYPPYRPIRLFWYDDL